MPTADHIPPPKDLLFLPAPPPLELYSNGNARVLEIGPGKGEFLLHQAAQAPSSLFVGLEIKKRRFEKIALRAGNLELKNLFMVRGDARECLPRIFPAGSLDRIYVLFPDPFPKKKQAKHRLLKVRLIQQLWELLKGKGEVYSATDASFYSDQIVECFDQAGGFRMEAIESLYPTYFETKWKKLGRKIDYWKFTKLETRALIAPENYAALDTRL